MDILIDYWLMEWGVFHNVVTRKGKIYTIVRFAKKTIFEFQGEH